jgi:isochorismate synthase EntC
VTTPWASADEWRAAPYPRFALLDENHLLVAEGARHTWSAPSTTALGPALAALPTDRVVVGCARFATAPVSAVDPAWAPLGGAAWWEPERLVGSPWLPSAVQTRSAQNGEDLCRRDAPHDGDEPRALDMIDTINATVVAHDLDHERFARAVPTALALIAQGHLHKLVVARRFFVPLREAWRLVPSFFRALLATSAQRGGTPYLVAPAPGTAFLGLSPEKLVVVDDDVRTEAVAGTRARAEAQELLTSSKDAREHDFVVEHLERALRSLGDAVGDVVVEPRRVRTVGAISHLHTTIRASRRPATSLPALVHALHPTPAVAGWPIEPAVAALARLEGFDRGIFGGVLGVVGPRRSSLSVGLRGALIDHNGLTITVGVGVVAGSNAADEDAESRLKLRAVLSSLGLREGPP